MPPGVPRLATAIEKNVRTRGTVAGNGVRRTERAAGPHDVQVSDVGKRRLGGDETEAHHEAHVVEPDDRVARVHADGRSMGCRLG